MANILRHVMNTPFPARRRTADALRKRVYIAPGEKDKTVAVIDYKAQEFVGKAMAMDEGRDLFNRQPSPAP
jgi:hypothetical protein